MPILSFSHICRSVGAARLLLELLASEARLLGDASGLCRDSELDSSIESGEVGLLILESDLDEVRARTVA